jgi:hypothetical protein
VDEGLPGTDRIFETRHFDVGTKTGTKNLWEIITSVLKGEMDAECNDIDLQHLCPTAKLR